MLSTITSWPPASRRSGRGLCLRPGQRGVRLHVRRGTWPGWWAEGPVVLTLWPGQEQHQHPLGMLMQIADSESESPGSRPWFNNSQGVLRTLQSGNHSDRLWSFRATRLLYVAHCSATSAPQITEECLYKSHLDLTLIFPWLLLWGSYVVFFLQLRYSGYVNFFSF